jgi:hypothetical protein
MARERNHLRAALWWPLQKPHRPALSLTFIGLEQREPRFVSVETSILLAKLDHSEMVRYPAWRSQPDRARRLARSIDLENAVKIEQGMPNPFGATWNGRGANFARFSAFPLEGAAPLA